MNGYFGTIDTDYGIGTILSNFDSEYINHIIDDSFNFRFRPFTGGMPNMVDVLERQFIAIRVNTPDYIQEIDNTRVETYKEIINKICTYYNLTFTGDFDNIEPGEIHYIAHTLYSIFLSNFTECMVEFFTSYIIKNADYIVDYLKTLPNANIPKENNLAYNSKQYIDPKFVLIHANINTVIYNMAAYDIPLPELLKYIVGYFLDGKDYDKFASLLVDNGDIYKNYYASYILNESTSANMLTTIKLALQTKTQELYNITQY